MDVVLRLTDYVLLLYVVNNLHSSYSTWLITWLSRWTVANTPVAMHQLLRTTTLRDKLTGLHLKLRSAKLCSCHLEKLQLNEYDEERITSLELPISIISAVGVYQRSTLANLTVAMHQPHTTGYTHLELRSALLFNIKRKSLQIKSLQKTVNFKASNPQKTCASTATSNTP